jgi:hypothetical protein
LHAYPLARSEEFDLSLFSVDKHPQPQKATEAEQRQPQSPIRFQKRGDLDRSVADGKGKGFRCPDDGIP